MKRRCLKRFPDLWFYWACKLKTSDVAGKSVLPGNQSIFPSYRNHLIGFNPFHHRVVFHIGTGHLFCSANQMPVFYMKLTTLLKWVHMMGTLAPRWLAVLLLQCVSSLKEWNCSVFGSFNRFYFTCDYSFETENSAWCILPVIYFVPPFNGPLGPFLHPFFHSFFSKLRYSELARWIFWYFA